MVLKKNLKNSFKIAEEKRKLETEVPLAEKNKIEQYSNKQENEVENTFMNIDNDYEAPDGGWGWMVTLGLIVVFVTTIGPNASFTVIFGDFFDSTGAAGSVTTMLNSLFNVTYSLASLVTSPLLKQFSMRTVGVIGAMLFAVPNVTLGYIRHVIEMAVIFFFQGIGMGLLFTICNTNFNAYFEKKRSMVMGVSQAIVGAGGIVYPILIEFMMEEYGFRGTSLIIGALSLNCIPAMALMKPPAIWKAKIRARKSTKENTLAEEREELLSTANSQPKPREVDVLKKNEKWNSTRSLQEEKRIDVPELMSEVRVASVSDVEKGVQRGRSMSLLPIGRPNWSKTRKNSLLASFTPSSLTNIRVLPGSESLNQAVLQFGVPRMAINEDDRDSEPREAVGIRKKVENSKTKRILDSLIDFSLLKNRSFLNACLGLSFVSTSDFTFLGFLPMMMSRNGFTKADAALAITVSASAELISRICLAVFTIFVDVRPKVIYFGAMILMTFAKAGYLYLEDTLTGTISMVVVIGFTRSWLLVPQPLVVVEDIGVDQIAAAYGVYGIVSGVISVILGPFAGFIKDWTDSFTVCQVVLLVMNALFIVPWGMELAMDRRNILNNNHS
ncbi:monocarboxylate transporter 14-like isoform X2 [Phymastichus coffea]|uniref:monocarboxylate transporter 14-like isoform X2 n=1 Tax=Phymastichus coffea TaxID=108790 RepID=UPI00273BC462|nr:monocarboxylate transporter 14-like isoform X2 [Phymastichus coffea]